VSGRLLEICCDSLESVEAAAAGGADRIELCVDLSADGLTPPVGLLQAAKAAVAIPVFVLVRCRPGDFIFSDRDVQAMVAEIQVARGGGADGIVCGALCAGGVIDVPATQCFMAAAEGLPFTFHKAFDACEDLEAAMADLVALGVDRVLTSAGERRAVDALERLARLAVIGGEDTRVLCGGGVRAENLAELVRVPGLREFHSAARPSVAEPVDRAEVAAMVTVLAQSPVNPPIA
jgi:copper homeostasis protein